MKKLLIALAILIFCGETFSQIYTPVFPTQYGNKVNRQKTDSVLHIPFGSDTLLRTNDTSSQIRVIEGNLSYHYGKWITVLTSALSEVDPLSWHIVDTASGLSKYLRKSDTTGKWQQKGNYLINEVDPLSVKISDSSLMLSKYLRIADTTNKWLSFEVDPYSSLKNLSNTTVPFKVGSGYGDNFISGDSSYNFTRDFDPTRNSNGHGLTVSDVFKKNSNGYAYAAFDARSIITGTADYNHMVAFQNATRYRTTGTTSYGYGIFSQPIVDSGIIDNYTHLKINDISGDGLVNDNYGILINNLSKGSGYNYGILSNADVKFTKRLYMNKGYLVDTNQMSELKSGMWLQPLSASSAYLTTSSSLSSEAGIGYYRSFGGASGYKAAVSISPVNSSTLTPLLKLMKSGGQVVIGDSTVNANSKAKLVVNGSGIFDSLYATGFYTVSGDRLINTDSIVYSTRWYRQKGIDSVVSLLPDVTGYMRKSDSTIYSTKANYKKGMDSLGSVFNFAIGFRVGYSDTANMLSPYTRSANVAGIVANKLNISDTANMLSPYTRLSVLPNYLNKFDSTLYSTKANYKKGMDSIGGIISANTSNIATNTSNIATKKSSTDSVHTVADNYVRQDRLKMVVDSASGTKQATITLTTTGASGAATFSSNTLNIPQYTGSVDTTTIATRGYALNLANGKANIASPSFTTQITTPKITSTSTLQIANSGTAYFNTGSAIVTGAGTSAFMQGVPSSTGYTLIEGNGGLGLQNSTLGSLPIIFTPNRTEKWRMDVNGSFNNISATGNTSAIIEVSSTTKGVLLPRMTKTQRDAISSPSTGLMVYQTDNISGLRVYNGTNWMRYVEMID